MKVAGIVIELPKTWQWANCSEVIDVRDGTHETPKYVSEGYPLVTSKNLKPDGIDFSTISYISEKDHLEISKRSRVDRNDILFAMIGTIGNPVLVDIDTEFSIKNVALFKFANSPIDPRYFRYLLKTRIIERQLDFEERGGTQKFVSLKVLRNMKIPYPPLEEQRKIAAILDKADGVRRKRQEAIRLTEELLRSTFLEMFGDPVTNPKGWEIVKIENIIELVSGQVDPRESPYSNMLHVGGDNIESGTGEISGCKTPAELSLISGKYLFRKGDILYSKIRPYLNKVSLPDFDGVCSADIYPIRVNHSCVTPIYMTSILRSKGFLEYAEKHSTRTNIPKINRKALLSFECPLPPLGLQNQFTNSANKILKIKDHEKTGVDKANNLFNSLLQRAFRGEL